MVGTDAIGRRSSCREAVDPGDPALPVAGSGKLAQVRKSKTSRWRAGVLLAVHLAIAAHATHFLLRGRTLSPVEPSEAMYTLELGEVNAGFVFFAAALLSTLLFGRFFCGWGCHIVALQDLCGWLMKRAGIRPRPFRSRLLLWVPLIAALYMFAWPQIKRFILFPVLARVWPAGLGAFRPLAEFPGLHNAMMTDGFWDTFPGPLFAILTFASCGFLAVYLLGAKGFCTYACPYGGFFVLLDRYSPGKIVVDDRCEQCGHCTATCTSNVRVHEEVRRYGQVVDPGCMKCMDCVSVCPKGALSFSFARPSVLAGPPRDTAAAPRYTYGLGEELFLLFVCAVACFALRGLYDGPPLLMSIGLGAITAFVALKAWHLIAKPTVRLQNFTLKLSGKSGTGGRVFAGLAVVWLLFVGHSAFVQWHRFWGRFHLERTLVTREEGLSGAFLGRTYPPGHRRALERTGRHFALADRWGLVPLPEIKLGLAWHRLLEDDVEGAIRLLEAAIALAPVNARSREDLCQLLLARGRYDEAREALEGKIDALGGSAEDHFRLAVVLTELGRHDEAVGQYRACLREQPDAAVARYNLGGLLRRLGRPAEAIAELREAERLVPGDADTQVELGLALQAEGRPGEAVEAFRRAIELAPGSPESLEYLPGLIEQLERDLDREDR